MDSDSVRKTHLFNQFNMTNEILKAKEILNKTFCFMEWQANDARARGETLMKIDDIEYLLSLDGFAEGDVVSFASINEESYDSSLLFETIETAKNTGKQGVCIMCTILTGPDSVRLKKSGYYIVDAGHGSVIWDEIYFSEEAYIRNRISHFKHLFGGLQSVSYVL